MGELTAIVFEDGFPGPFYMQVPVQWSSRAHFPAARSLTWMARNMCRTGIDAKVVVNHFKCTKALSARNGI